MAVGGAVLAAWAIFLRGQLVALQHYPWQIAPQALVLGVLWGALYFGGLALGWALLLQHIAGGRLPLAGAVRVWLGSMSTRYLPGNVWHILSRVALAGRLQVPASQVLASAVVEQVLTLLGALALCVVTLPFWGVAPSAQGWLLLLLPLGLALLHPRIFGAALGSAASLLRRPELHWRYTYRELLWLLGGYSGAMLCAGMALYTLLWGLSPVRPGHLPLALGAAALAWAVGYLSLLTPAGLGVREAVLVALLANVFPMPVAIVSSLLFRLVVTLGEILAVGLAWGSGWLIKDGRKRIIDDKLE